MKHLSIICLIVLVATTIACNKTQKTQYVGEWKVTNVSPDGKKWDSTILPDEEVTLTLEDDMTVKLKMGDFEETANWHIDDNGNVIMGEQSASLDDAGNLVAELNGMLVRLEKK